MYSDYSEGNIVTMKMFRFNYFNTKQLELSIKNNLEYYNNIEYKHNNEISYFVLSGIIYHIHIPNFRTPNQKPGPEKGFFLFCY